MFHTSDGRKVIENLDEFDDAREVVAGLAAEYQACERPDYVSLLCMINMQSCMDTSMRITCKDCRRIGLWCKDNGKDTGVRRPLQKVRHAWKSPKCCSLGIT